MGAHLTNQRPSSLLLTNQRPSSQLMTNQSPGLSYSIITLHCQATVHHVVLWEPVIIFLQSSDLYDVQYVLYQDNSLVIL